MASEDKRVSRRRFIQATLAGSAAAAAAPLASAKLAAQPFMTAQAQTAAEPGQLASQPPLPTRKLGRTGVDVSILSLGGMMQALNSHFLDVAWSLGIRYVDTARLYINQQSEKRIGAWLKQHPERRKSLFLATKDDRSKQPSDLLTLIDQRLEALGTDYVDLFYLHGIGPKEYGQQSYEWPKSKELKEVAEKLKKSGKVRYFGFTSHDADRARYMQAAAEGGFIDVIMFSYAPFMKSPDELNRSMDACVKANIGLVAMKIGRTMPPDLPKRIPEFDKLGLTVREALLHAAWSDERIAAVCSNIENLQQMTENTGAARKYAKPLKPGQIEALAQLVHECTPTFCPNCDGRCQRAAGTRLALNTIARYVSYYEMDGSLEARELYRSLPAELRQADAADLAAAEEACLCKLKFSRILKKAERYFA
ncbi:MAG: aldo/keto reductase [bacterium]|nr:aldo/keto reductase [bacterium]